MSQEDEFLPFIINLLHKKGESRGAARYPAKFMSEGGFMTIQLSLSFIKRQLICQKLLQSLINFAGCLAVPKDSKVRAVDRQYKLEGPISGT